MPLLVVGSTTTWCYQYPHNAVTSPVHYCCQAIQALIERERHVNIQAIVEEHYERYLDQEEEYMREAANNKQMSNA